MSTGDAPLDRYVAAYTDPTAADADWDQVKQLAKDTIITVDALDLVRRDADGKIHIRDNAHDTDIGAIGGLIFSPRRRRTIVWPSSRNAGSPTW